MLFFILRSFLGVLAQDESDETGMYRCKLAKLGVSSFKLDSLDHFISEELNVEKMERCDI